MTQIPNVPLDPGAANDPADPVQPPGVGAGPRAGTPSSPSCKGERQGKAWSSSGVKTSFLTQEQPHGNNQPGAVKPEQSRAVDSSTPKQGIPQENQFSSIAAVLDTGMNQSRNQLHSISEISGRGSALDLQSSRQGPVHSRVDFQSSLLFLLQNLPSACQDQQSQS